MFRNATRTASGDVDGRVGPWDILTKIRMRGTVTQEEVEKGVGAFLAECGTTIDISYAMAHIFTDRQVGEYRAAPPGSALVYRRGRRTVETPPGCSPVSRGGGAR
jgi:hypothetical protein